MSNTIFHDSQEIRFRSPFGAAETGSKIKLSICAPESANCFVRLWTDKDGETLVEMKRCCNAFSAEIDAPTDAGLLWYYFIITISGKKLFYGAPNDGLGGVGQLRNHEPNSWQITVFDYAPSPEWYKDSIVYQIFPDRFHRGSDWKKCREASSREDTRRGPRRLWHEDWNDRPFYTKNPRGEVTRWDFFGGTLEGIREKISYLKELGISSLYLNPIVKAASNHRYDTADYMEVDPALGDNESFKRLCKEAEENGIRIILDGVFSHTGADSKYFDFFGNYGKVGAFSDPKSTYIDWYKFSNYPHEYDSWWGVGDLPNVNELNPSFLDYIVTGENSVCKHWLNLGASGWRLDVADELPDSFIEQFKTETKKVRCDSLLLGEVWEDASNKKSYGESRRYLLGKELDSTMHYPFRTAVNDFLLNRIDSYQLKRILMSIAENYPPEALFSALNLIGSHDRARSITVLGEAPEHLSDHEKEYYELTPEQYEKGKNRLKIAAMLQFVTPGVPCVYYGDEAGLTGYEDPFNRGTYPWGNEDSELLEFYKKLANIYNRYSILRHGDFKYVCINHDIFACRRKTPETSIITVINRTGAEQTVQLKGLDLFTKTPINGDFILAPYGGCIVLEDISGE